MLFTKLVTYFSLLCLAAASVGFLLWIIFSALRPATPKESGRSKDSNAVVQVLVLGDIGRSPRMTYHALSIARLAGRVDLVGYLDTPPHPDILRNPNIQIHALPPPPVRPRHIPFLLFGPWKAVNQLYHLSWVLNYRLQPAQWLLVQNPPSIPTLFVASVTCYLRKTRLMIDWHNYGWTILAGNRGSRHPLVSLARAYECFFGRFGHVNLTVTEAMGRELRRAPYRVESPILTLHDRPADIFRPVNSRSERLAILARIFPGHPLVPLILDGSARLIVSSTSWTPDEDFSLLLDALVRYASDGSVGKGEKQPPVLVVITGKGPQKDMYMEQIEVLRKSGALQDITVETSFLSFPDYAGLLASADLGICLHKSSSGVDLPMKIVDMFGAGLPVAAYSGYESFAELVKEGENGRGFETAAELAEILAHLLSERGRRELETLKAGAVNEGSRRWDSEWDAIVAPILGLHGRVQ
ncbi:hypothetical protein VTK73DRAFT_1278 [Phialemonium thermophilum]|uniref:Chitobiosyldiphosphodolichol beta-mannosyltransferase n=1 Tax=Phialemonium thermophilum TaxID=223376 RepID=A0ABR3XA11_9PEZI